MPAAPREVESDDAQHDDEHGEQLVDGEALSEHERADERREHHADGAPGGVRGAELRATHATRLLDGAAQRV